MPSRMAWVQRPSGLMKVGEVQVLFSGSYLGWCRECFLGANINDQSKLLLDRSMFCKAYKNQILLHKIDKKFLVTTHSSLVTHFKRC